MYHPVSAYRMCIYWNSMSGGLLFLLLSYYVNTVNLTAYVSDELYGNQFVVVVVVASTGCFRR